MRTTIYQPYPDTVIIDTNYTYCAEKLYQGKVDFNILYICKYNVQIPCRFSFTNKSKQEISITCQFNLYVRGDVPELTGDFYIVSYHSLGRNSFMYPYVYFTI